MKESSIVIILVTYMVTVLLAMIFIPRQTTPKVDLPEEYQEITKDTPIQGYFRGDTLVIEFKHHYNEK